MVSAPAAVGKTMLAEHLAYRTGGALWNLADFHVGNNFAVGTVASAHGPAALSKALERLQSGSFVIVADALDEARLRVSFDAFAAFLDDMAREILAPAVPGRPALVLLARGETAEFASDWLRESGVEVAAIGIEFFDHPGALAFVDKQIAARDKDPSQESMVKARDEMFAQTLALLGVTDGEWPLDTAGRFLGYAPVLVALGRHLAEGGNPQLLAQQMSAPGAPDTMWRFLVALVEDILKREQQKFVDGFRNRLGSMPGTVGFSDWSSVFTPREQCSWLLSEALEIAPPATTVPPELRDEYQSQVSLWLPNHVLTGASLGRFASPVFEEWAYAQALVEGEFVEQAAVRARVAGASYQPTELLARFLFALADGAPALQPADLSAVYESLAAGEEAGRPAELEVTDDEGLRAAVTVRNERLEFAFSTDDDPLVLTRRLGRASIRLESHGIRLGASGRSFEIGPDVSVRATVVEIAAESLLVRGEADASTDVVLVADAVKAAEPTFRIARGGDRLKVRSKEPLRHPLAERSIPVDDDQGALSPEVERAATALFRLMAYFKSEGYGGLGSYSEPIDRKASRDETFRRLLDFARDRGLVSQEKSIYKLHPETVGLDYQSVQAQILSEEARSFLREFTSPGG